MPSHNLETLEVYRLAVELNVTAYPELRTIRDYAYRDQMVRSCLSIASNIAEGYGRQNRNMFRQFVGYALGSLFEFQTQVRISGDLGLITGETADRLNRRMDELIPKLIRFRDHLERASTTNNNPPTTNRD